MQRPPNLGASDKHDGGALSKEDNKVSIIVSAIQIRHEDLHDERNSGVKVAGEAGQRRGGCGDAELSMQVERLIISDERHLTPAVRPKLIDVIMLGVRDRNSQLRDVEERHAWPGCDRSCYSSQRAGYVAVTAASDRYKHNTRMYSAFQTDVVKGRSQVKTRKEKARLTCRTLASVRFTSGSAQNHRHSAEYHLDNALICRDDYEHLTGEDDRQLC